MNYFNQKHKSAYKPFFAEPSIKISNVDFMAREENLRNISSAFDKTSESLEKVNPPLRIAINGFKRVFS